mmetsp:Transcript_11526/g.31982  ORF Transcript_11526/g.31982 Transcript_11526/m.31982 type:complete len:284 (+) Transcript_11526:642-1493(+)
MGRRHVLRPPHVLLHRCPGEEDVVHGQDHPVAGRLEGEDRRPVQLRRDAARAARGEDRGVPVQHVDGNVQKEGERGVREEGPVHHVLDRVEQGLVRLPVDLVRQERLQGQGLALGRGARLQLLLELHPSRVGRGDEDVRLEVPGLRLGLQQGGDAGALQGAHGQVKVVSAEVAPPALQGPEDGVLGVAAHHGLRSDVVPRGGGRISAQEGREGRLPPAQVQKVRCRLHVHVEVHLGHLRLRELEQLPQVLLRGEPAHDRPGLARPDQHRHHYRSHRSQGGKTS